MLRPRGQTAGLDVKNFDLGLVTLASVSTFWLKPRRRPRDENFGLGLGLEHLASIRPLTANKLRMYEMQQNAKILLWAMSHQFQVYAYFRAQIILVISNICISLDFLRT